MALDGKLVISQFFTLGRVGDVHVQGNVVRGRFVSFERLKYDPIKLCEDFANTEPDLEGIRWFTKKYGPLHEPLVEVGRDFDVSVADWRMLQSMCRVMWKHLVKHQTNPQAERIYGVSQGDYFVISASGNGFQFSTLYKLIVFWLSALPPERRRVCSRTGCETFFVATHWKERYCGPECSEWGQRQAKLKHWQTNKTEYLAKRQRASNNTGRKNTNVSRKAR